MATPTRIITRQRIRLIALNNVEYEREQQAKAEEEAKRKEVERARGKR